MSNITPPTNADTPSEPYKPGTGPLRYARFCEDWLGLERTKVFDEIARALNENKQTLAVGGNGVSKSYSASALGVAALYCNPNTVVPVTAGNGDTLKNSIWKPIKSLWRNSPLPGDYKDNDRSLHTEFDDEWFLECHSPQYPEDLEGDHNANVIYIIEEAEKPGVTSDHIDSARSTLADGDHILVLCNPPTDESNVVYELEQKDSWNVLRFPTWESRNARVDRDLTDASKIGGLSGVGKMQDDWTEYHDEEWPGIQQVIEWSSPYLTEDGGATVRESDAVKKNPDFREDLHERWYKRRAGVIPPQGADIHRPFHVPDVQAARNRQPEQGALRGIAFDIARDGGDKSACVKYYEGVLEAETWQVSDEEGHAGNRERIHEILSTDGEHRNAPVAVDAIGEGSDIADMVRREYGGVRFKSLTVAEDEENYDSKWAEGLARLGSALEDVTFGGSDGTELRKQLFAGARAIQYDRKGTKKHEVYEATPKAEVKEMYGESPDLLDAAVMAAWVADSSEADTDVLAFQL
jgi:hypothetical protein